MLTVNAASKQEIEALHTLLIIKYPPIYADIWKVGVNVSLRISDLLNVKFSDCHLEERSMTLVEAKTGKTKVIRLNNVAINIIQQRKHQYPSDSWLFQVHCNRAKDKPVSRVSVSRVFK
jgi:integrase